MKSARFSYERPNTVEDALEMLGANEAKALAGGQSLVPMMAMRLVRPRLLVDLGRLEQVGSFRRENGALVVGAMVRQRTLERSAEVAGAVPLLSAALPHVGHREIRNRGTIGGSIAHADPSAELPLVAATLGATLDAHGPEGEHALDAADFFTGPFQTRLAEGELLLRVRFPVARAGDGFAFAEVARRHGDYALCGVAAHVHREDGRPAARVGVMGAGPVPSVHDLTEDLDAGGPSEWDRLAEAVSERLEPSDDMHASGPYRRRLVCVLVARCLERAFADAGKEQR